MSNLPNKTSLVGNPTAGQFKVALGEFYDYVSALHFWGKGKTIEEGDIIFKPNSTSSVYAKCILAGTTGTAEPVWPAEGNTIADGTVTWVMLEVGDTKGFRNKLINGNFAINQDAVSGTVTLAAGKYGHDGWKAGASGCTYTFTTVNNVTTLTITAGSLLQIVEGINLQSGTHVLSWQGTAQGKIDGGSYGASGVTGTATGGTNMTVEFNTGTLSNVQLEPGLVATTFEQRPAAIEDMLCKRYYEIVGTVLVAAVGQSYPLCLYKVYKRANPTITLIFVDSGTGATFQALPDPCFGCYQVINHSVATRALITVDSRL